MMCSAPILVTVGNCNFRPLLSSDKGNTVVESNLGTFAGFTYQVFKEHNVGLSAARRAKPGLLVVTNSTGD